MFNLLKTAKSSRSCKDLKNQKSTFINFSIKENDWQTYKGFFKNGKKHGVGILQISDKFQFTGEFSEGELDGYGVLRSLSPQKLEFGKIHIVGVWKKNKLTRML